MKKSDFDGLIKGLKEASGFVRAGKLKGGRIHIPRAIDAAAIRAKVGLSQVAFAREIGVSVATLRNWEQGRRNPTGPARALLRAIQADPANVLRALRVAA